MCKFTLMDLTGGGMEMMDPGQVLESGGVIRVRNYLGDHKKSPKGDLRGLNFMLKETIRGLNQVQRGTLYKKSAKIMR